MRYVIFRDDDTNALTPIECLERLYRPFLDRGLPVNLSLIPEVRSNLTLPDGRPEGFLLGRAGSAEGTRPIGANPKLVRYLVKNRGYYIVQHGCHHDYFEFAGRNREQMALRLDQGASRLLEAGLPKPHTFVAPHDKFSDVSLTEAAKRFYIVSSGWYELRRLPMRWWPGYLRKKILKKPHWRAANTTLLSHPGCLLSCNRPYETMLQAIKDTISRQRLTVLVTHWWEYFRNNQPDQKFIDILHQTAAYLADEPSIEVISFDDLVSRNIAF